MASMTVTAGETAANEVALQVFVLTGAVETGGITPTWYGQSSSVTPNTTNSIVVWGQENFNNATIPTIATNNTYQSSVAGSLTNTYGFGYYSGTVTGGTAITIGNSTTTCESAGVEIHSAGSAVPVIHSSTPALAAPFRTTSATSASFTPPAGSVLVAILSAYDTASTVTPTVSNTGTTLTWTQRSIENQFNQGLVVVWTATVPPLTNNYNGGTNGNSITTGNSGGTSGNAFDITEVFGSSTFNFTNSPTHISNFSGAFVAPTSSESDAGWSTSFTAAGVTQVWFRMYCNLANVTNSFYAIDFRNTSGSALGKVSFNNAQIQLIDSTGASQANSALTLAANTWFRIEGYFIGSATTGQIQCKTFQTNVDGTTPDETLTTGATINTSGLVGQVLFGCRFNSGAGTVTNNTTGLGLTVGGYLGPMSSGATPISVSDFAGVVESPGIVGTIVTVDAAGLVESYAMTVTNPVSDFAGVVETPSISATVLLNDSAGLVESQSETATVPVTDAAGMVESQGAVVTLAMADFAGVLDTLTVFNGFSISVSDYAAEVESSPAITVSAFAADSAGMVERITGSVGLSVSDMAGAVDNLFNSGVQGANLIRPAIVFVAATYKGDS